MAEKIINGFSVVAYATQPEGRTPPRAFLETRRLGKKDGAEIEAGGQDDDSEPDNQAFEIFASRRFRSTVEAMSAARNALDRVEDVDADGVPDHLPE
ncbi:hypothetical protein WHX56_15845 [Achromobacter veterisilvae]|jgi:hypothetical protein|uniref:Uncharacterized protein n=1 Tax=Achromobacter veterisilvae TaxID=2069367 RepID=A0ABZ2RSP0_9BURK|nr:hypothetical protein [Achromobacter sp.]MCW0205698.1 hypothetical protein [Achromobacter sp.]